MIDGNAQAAVFGATEIYLPLDDLINLEEEKARLSREVNKAEEELRRVRQKLANGDFLAKAFQGEGIDSFTRELKRHFRTVKTMKPRASRPESREIYLLARSLGM